MSSSSNCHLQETCFEMCPSSYVAELRAEVEYWLEKNVQAKKERQIAFAQLPSSHSSSVNEEHSFWRIVVSGQELSHDVDSKTLEEVGLKDQNVHRCCSWFMISINVFVAVEVICISITLCSSNSKPQ